MPALRRLFLALLTALLALPAMQANACAPLAEQAQMSAAHDHQATASSAHSHHDHGPAKPDPARAAPHHECIGCVAPIDMRVYRPVGQLEPPADSAVWVPHQTHLSDWLGTPETPPPRASI